MKTLNGEKIEPFRVFKIGNFSHFFYSKNIFSKKIFSKPIPKTNFPAALKSNFLNSINFLVHYDNYDRYSLPDRYYSSSNGDAIGPKGQALLRLLGLY